MPAEGCWVMRSHRWAGYGWKRWRLAQRSSWAGVWAEYGPSVGLYWAARPLRSPPRSSAVQLWCWADREQPEVQVQADSSQILHTHTQKWLKYYNTILYTHTHVRMHARVYIYTHTHIHVYVTERGLSLYTDQEGTRVCDYFEETKITYKIFF